MKNKVLNIVFLIAIALPTFMWGKILPSTINGGYNNSYKILKSHDVFASDSGAISFKVLFDKINSKTLNIFFETANTSANQIFVNGTWEFALFVDKVKGFGGGIVTDSRANVGFFGVSAEVNKWYDIKILWGGGKIFVLINDAIVSRTNFIFDTAKFGNVLFGAGTLINSFFYGKIKELAFTGEYGILAYQQNYKVHDSKKVFNSTAGSISFDVEFDKIIPGRMNIFFETSNAPPNQPEVNGTWNFALFADIEKGIGIGLNEFGDNNFKIIYNDIQFELNKKYRVVLKWSGNKISCIFNDHSLVSNEEYKFNTEKFPFLLIGAGTLRNSNFYGKLYNFNIINKEPSIGVDKLLTVKELKERQKVFLAGMGVSYGFLGISSILFPLGLSLHSYYKGYYDQLHELYKNASTDKQVDIYRPQMLNYESYMNFYAGLAIASAPFLVSSIFSAVFTIMFVHSQQIILEKSAIAVDTFDNNLRISYSLKL